MSVEIPFPIEFIVSGTPVSLQAKGRKTSLPDWKIRIQDAARTVLPEGHFASRSPISLTIYYFPATRMQGDIDNIVKPILDALGKLLYVDDRQVERVWVQKFEPGRVFEFANPSGTLTRAIEGEKPLLYVRVSDDPGESSGHAHLR